MANELKIEYLPVSVLKPYEKNAKKHPDDQVEHIANSIREFGFRQPLVIDKENVLVIGHGRLLAAKKLGLDSVPCVCADDLTDEQIKALRLADNKTNESEWDFDLLGGELDDIFDIDMEQFGFELEDDEDSEIRLSSKELSEYQYIHYLVTINVEEEQKYTDVIDHLKEMGAEVKETKNNT